MNTGVAGELERSDCILMSKQVPPYPMSTHLSGVSLFDRVGVNVLVVCISEPVESLFERLGPDQL